MCDHRHFTFFTATYRSLWGLGELVSCVCVRRLSNQKEGGRDENENPKPLLQSLSFEAKAISTPTSALVIARLVEHTHT